MFVAHGYDAWVLPASKSGLGYRITREVAAAALPSFLFLAGIGIALRWSRVQASERLAVRRALALRGLRLVVLGYALSVAYAWLDGGLGQPATWLRADVLHAIGASVLLTAVLALRERTARSAAWLALLTVLVCPPLTRVLGGTPAPLGYALAPLLPIAGITRFAAIPLAAFCFAGLALGIRRADTLGGRPAGARIALAGLALAALGALGTRALLSALGGTLGPAHPALLANAVDGLGRALCVLGLGGLLPARVLPPLALAGRHSLLLYAAHLPFCYGRIGAPLRARLDLPQASLAVMLLSALALLLCAALERPPPWLNSTQTAGRYRGRGD